MKYFTELLKILGVELEHSFEIRYPDKKTESVYFHDKRLFCKDKTSGLWEISIPIFYEILTGRVEMLKNVGNKKEWRSWNYIPEIAKIFGVEMNEEFLEEHLGSYYRSKFTENGLETWDSRDKDWQLEKFGLAVIFDGSTIIHKSFLTKDEAKYLYNVVEPFDARVIDFSLEAVDDDPDLYSIVIRYIRDYESEKTKELVLPPNWRNHKYKKLELGKRYSPAQIFAGNKR